MSVNFLYLQSHVIQNVLESNGSYPTNVSLLVNVNEDGHITSFAEYHQIDHAALNEIEIDFPEELKEDELENLAKILFENQKEALQHIQDIQDLAFASLAEDMMRDRKAQELQKNVKLKDILNDIEKITHTHDETEDTFETPDFDKIFNPNLDLNNEFNLEELDISEDVTKENETPADNLEKSDLETKIQSEFKNPTSLLTSTLESKKELPEKDSLIQRNETISMQNSSHQQSVELHESNDIRKRKLEQNLKEIQAIQKRLEILNQENKTIEIEIENEDQRKKHTEEIKIQIGNIVSKMSEVTLKNDIIALRDRLNEMLK